MAHKKKGSRPAPDIAAIRAKAAYSIAEFCPPAEVNVDVGPSFAPERARLRGAPAKERA